MEEIGLETDTGSCQEDRPFFLSVLKGLLDLHKILRRPFAERKFPKKKSYPVDNVDNFVYNPNLLHFLCKIVVDKITHSI